MKILLRTTSTNEHAEGCEYAVVEITAELAKTVLTRRNLFREAQAKDNALGSMRFSHWAPSYYDAYDLGFTDPGDAPVLNADSLSADEQRDLFDDEPVTLADDFPLPENEARTECDTMVIRSDGVAWSAAPKHASYYVRTSMVRWDVFEEML